MVHSAIATSEIDAKFWSTYRPRRAVAARRLGRPTWVDGCFHRDGYMVRDELGHFAVVGVAAFEAVYEVAGREG